MMKKIRRIIGLFLAALACMSITACTPWNIEKAEERMEKEGYTVIAYEDDEEGLVGGLVATKAEGILEVDMITALLFETREDAKNFAEKAEGTGAIQDGKWVYWGDEDAIEDFTELF